MTEIDRHVLPARYGGGPHGIGDPNDKTLRKVEIDVLVPKIMRERARKEKCSSLVQEFEKCCVSNGFAMILKCRKENDEMKDCLKKWYEDKDFIKECTEIYLKDRSEYRQSGITKKEQMKRMGS